VGSLVHRARNPWAAPSAKVRPSDINPLAKKSRMLAPWRKLAGFPMYGPWRTNNVPITGGLAFPGVTFRLG
jgi:hypothetical protein